MEKRLLLFLLILSCPLIAQTKQWRSCLPNKFMYDCLTAGNYLYTINYNGLIKYDLITDGYTNYTKSNSSLKFNSPSKLAKDNNNNIWFYTQNSLVKFDGTGFTPYPFTKEHLRGNGIAVDSLNNVWIASGWGLVKFSGGTFEILKPDTLENYFSGVDEIAAAPSGDIWIASNNYIARYDGEKWTAFRNEIPGFYTYCLYVDKNNNLWAGGHQAYYVYNGSSWVYHSTSSLVQEDVEVITEDSRGRMWFGTEQGISVLDGTRWTHYKCCNSPLPNLSIKAICPDSGGAVYIATGNGTVKYLDGTWQNYSFSEYNFSYDQIHDAVVDRFGRLWVASGLNYGQQTGLLIYPDSLQYFELETLHTVNLKHWYWWIQSIFIDRSNNKWITTTYGLDKVNDDGEQLFNVDNSGIPDNYTFAAAQDAAGNIWIGTIYGGLAKYDGTNWTVYDTTNSALPSNAVTQIIIDKNQNIWAATENGLAEFTGSSWKVINKDNSDIKDNVIFHFALDNNGGIWLGNQYGLHHFDGFRWENFDDSNSPLATNFINDIKVDKDNNVWVAVNRGGLLKKSADGWTVFNEDNSPLLHNDINSLFIDQNSNIIIGTNSGLNIFNEGGVNLFYEPDPEKLSDYFSLSQNYPNPFNISTRMMYEVGAEAWVRIKVYNILGKEVGTLVNERKVPGYYSVDFNGEGLASGVYICRMQVGSFVQSRKAILLK